MRSLKKQIDDTTIAFRFVSMNQSIIGTQKQSWSILVLVHIVVNTGKSGLLVVNSRTAQAISLLVLLVGLAAELAMRP